MGRAVPARAMEGVSDREIERGLATRALAGVRVALWAAIGTALSADEKSRLGVALYDAGDEYRDAPHHAWEDAWHARWLPGRHDDLGVRRDGVAGRDEDLGVRRDGVAGRDEDVGAGRDGVAEGGHDVGVGGHGDAVRALHRDAAPAAPPEDPAAISGRRPRVLVGAAGAGREVLALLGRGCEVVAVEPSPALAALCRTRTEGRVTVIEGRYEDLVLHDFFVIGGERNVAPGSVKAPTGYARPAAPWEERASGEGEPPEGDVRRASGEGEPPEGDVRHASGEGEPPEGDVRPASGEVEPPEGDVRRASGEGGREEALAFDAVLLGLGSLSHVLDAAARVRLLETLARACPRGPILASALTPPRGAAGIEASREGRAARMGRAAARPLRAARHLPPIEAGEVVFDALGFAKLFTHEELRALGAACGRRTIFDDGAPEGMALCAFVPA